jgi:thiol-disulfide isomerase/thioredoxin
MAKAQSAMVDLGSPIPDFELPNCLGGQVSSADFKSGAALVMFWCNHCPYVKHVVGKVVDLSKEWIAQGVKVLAINANDIKTYPEDHPDLMRVEAEKQGYGFPYVFDETQSVAKSFRAACTPDFFLYRDGLLAYRGQLDDSRPGGQVPVTGKDLGAAILAILAGKAVSETQKPGIGCSIKWKL